ncbi:MAG: Fe-S cluster assembly protein SufD [Actinomycetota bacterium]|nr:Fe-S cluster assembly protein SufD [Actinomycetota bacterium]
MFSTEAIDQLAGPDWLQARRISALERAAETGLPSAHEEVWRYTPIGDLELGSFSPVLEAPASMHPDRSGIASDDVVAGSSVIVDLADGHLVGIANAEGVQGVRVELVAEAADGDDLLGRALPVAFDAFNEINLALAPSPIVIRIARGTVLDGPVVVRHRSAAADALTCSRVIVVAGENSEATVVEVHESGDERALAIPVTELVVEQAARLRHLSIQAHGTSVWQLGTQVATIDQDGYLLAAAVALGGAYARLRTDTKMIGRGATGDIIAAFFGDGDQTLDFRTFQQHVAPNTQSNLLFKGALDEAARSIYTGLIRIEKDAAGVTAHQTNRNIKLSQDAWAESVPNLEIENNDVKCSHASAVGPIDEEQRFYLESRGVPTDVAERLVVQGFFNEVLRQLPYRAVVDQVEELLTSRLQVGSDS